LGNGARGLTLVFTGNGKGKTTAALGMAVRAWGHGLKVLILQFIKGNGKSGELKAVEKLGSGIEIRQMGNGFIRDADGNELNVHRSAAQKALEEARRAVLEGDWDMVILDEVSHAVVYGLVDLPDLLEIIKCKPFRLHLVLTGRNMAAEVTLLADLVTEMREVKHPFNEGISAQMGIEF